jgi:hypothetical protein
VDKKFSGTAIATSKNPHDWGRAMSVALEHLLSKARMGGFDIEHEHLYDQNLHINFREAGTGVQISLSWSPEPGAPLREDDPDAEASLNA